MNEKTRADYDREAAERLKLEDERLSRLEVPTYSNRKLNPIKVTKLKGRDMTSDSGWSCYVPEEVLPHIHVGKELIQETIQFSRITGWLIDGKWITHESDQDLERERLAYIEESKAKYQAIYEANKDKWQAEEDALPDWLRVTFKDKDEEFLTEPMGYGYALIIARLAVLYAELGEVILDKDVFTISDHESDAIKALSREEGTSGNQHAVALSFAKNRVRTLEAIDKMDLPDQWETEDGTPNVLGTHDRDKASRIYNKMMKENVPDDYENAKVEPEEWQLVWMTNKDFLLWADDRIDQWVWQEEYSPNAVPGMTCLR